MNHCLESRPKPFGKTTRFLRLLSVVGVGPLFFGFALYAQNPDFSGLLKNRLPGTTNATIGNEHLYKADLVKEFYEKRNWQAVWFDGKNRLLQRTPDFLDCSLRKVQEQGLLPADYHVDAIENIVAAAYERVLNPDELADMEILLSDAYLLLGTHLMGGKVDPDNIDIAWHLPSRHFDMVYYFEEAVAYGDLCYSMELLEPVHLGYKQLKAALAFYRNLHWDKVEAPPNLILQKDDYSPLVPIVRRRLEASGDIAPGSGGENPEYFDKTLQRAVMKFQKNLGMHYDGLVRDYTVLMMNIPAEERVKQIIANLERLRWLPDELGPTHIAVNIPKFELVLYENGKPAYTEHVVVGQRNFPTPAFSDSMTYFVLNPYWYIPQSIAKDELLPTVLDDPNHFQSHDIRAFKNNKEVDTGKIDWTAADPSDYWFRQGINVNNPMGQVKFMFPNKYDVYLHDTPHKDLFNISRRSYSHGCIRMNQSLNFAEHLVKNYVSDWTVDKMKAALEEQKETKVELDTPIPIHIFYTTAFVNDEGELNFREDIYNWDAKLYDALSQPLHLQTSGKGGQTGKNSTPTPEDQP